jgi:hypothetical protein
MVDVGVGENNRVEILDRQRKASILVRRILPLSLKHSAVERDSVSVYVQQMAGTGDFSGRADKRYLQQLAFCYRIALEEDRDALLVLRHHCGLPASSASLVQEISESILVFPRMPRQLDHHSLVFFHRELEIMSR